MKMYCAQLESNSEATMQQLVYSSQSIAIFSLSVLTISTDMEEPASQSPQKKNMSSTPSYLSMIMIHSYLFFW